MVCLQLLMQQGFEYLISLSLHRRDFFLLQLVR